MTSTEPSNSLSHFVPSREPSFRALAVYARFDGACQEKGSGGLRAIYYWDPAEDCIYLLFLYPKNQQEDLTPDQLKVLRRIVQEDLK
jgi:hypothetical protein